MPTFLDNALPSSSGNPEIVGRRFMRNVGSRLRDCMKSQGESRSIDRLDNLRCHIDLSYHAFSVCFTL